MSVSIVSSAKSKSFDLVGLLTPVSCDSSVSSLGATSLSSGLYESVFIDSIALSSSTSTSAASDAISDSSTTGPSSSNPAPLQTACCDLTAALASLKSISLITFSSGIWST